MSEKMPPLQAAEEIHATRYPEAKLMVLVGSVIIFKNHREARAPAQSENPAYPH